MNEPATLAVPPKGTQLVPSVPPSSGELEAAALLGPQKALLLLMSLEEGAATRLLAQLSVDDVRRLRRACDEVRAATPEQLATVHVEFISYATRPSASLKGSSAYLRRLAGKAFGEGKIANLWSEPKPVIGGVAALASLEVETIFAILEDESPQAMAVLLAQFPADKSAKVLAMLDEAARAEVLLRMARTQNVPENVMRDLEEQMTAEVGALEDVEKLSLPGMSAAAGILKRMPHDAADKVLTVVAGEDATTADALRKALFTFEDLVRIEGRGMQILLKEVQSEQLVLALKSASDDLREKVFGNLSARAAGLIREELEMLGAVRLADVETAQEAIVQAAIALEKDSKITIAREGGNDYV